MEAVVDPNGGVAAAAKKTRLGAAAAAAAAAVGETGVYRECLKNHAVSLGGHALDECSEFMASLEADPADPSSLRCAACGCHRIFHRWLAELPLPPPLLALPPPPPPAAASPVILDNRTMRVEETEESDEGSDFDEDRALSPPLPTPAMVPPGYRQTAPHMLLATLSTGAPSPGVQLQTPAAAPRTLPASLGPMPARRTALRVAAALAARKPPFRTKFSPEQKQRMQALSERLCWRLQKRDEAVVDDCCQEIGVTKGVFKVMHNNKRRSKRRSVAAKKAATTAASAIHHPSATADAAAVYPCSSHAAPAPAAAVHPSAHVAPPPAPVHVDFNMNGAATDVADYFRIQPSTASGGSPQSS